MEFLSQCPTVKIEDILPFFPDFVTIAHFKSAIVESLQEYSKHITQLKVGRILLLQTLSFNMNLSVPLRVLKLLISHAICDHINYH